MERFEKIALEDTPVADVVLGLCPGCELWQVDYTNAVRDSYVWWQHQRNFKTGEVRSVPIFDEWHELIEDLMAEHVLECVHLQRLLVD